MVFYDVVVDFSSSILHALLSDASVPQVTS